MAPHRLLTMRRTVTTSAEISVSAAVFSTRRRFLQTLPCVSPPAAEHLWIGEQELGFREAKGTKRLLSLSVSLAVLTAGPSPIVAQEEMQIYSEGGREGARCKY